MSFRTDWAFMHERFKEARKELQQWRVLVDHQIKIINL